MQYQSTRFYYTGRIAVVIMKYLVITLLVDDLPSFIAHPRKKFLPVSISHLFIANHFSSGLTGNNPACNPAYNSAFKILIYKPQNIV